MTLNRPTKLSIAAAVRGDDGRHLVVRRPEEDESLGGFWGLPAVTLRDGELPEAAIDRIGTQKLGSRLIPARTVGVEVDERESYRIVLMVIEAHMAGKAPALESASGTGTLYVDWRWVEELSILAPAAEAGSLCCRIMLRHTPRDAR